MASSLTYSFALEILNQAMLVTSKLSRRGVQCPRLRPICNKHEREKTRKKEEF